jgi:hypothetical protein
MFVGDVLLDERSSFEEFLARLASKLALIFLLDVRFNGFRQLPA